MLYDTVHETNVVNLVQGGSVTDPVITPVAFNVEKIGSAAGKLGKGTT
jgi:hypothetical protein